MQPTHGDEEAWRSNCCYYCSYESLIQWQSKIQIFPSVPDWKITLLCHRIKQMKTCHQFPKRTSQQLFCRLLLPQCCHWRNTASFLGILPTHTKTQESTLPAVEEKVKSTFSLLLHVSKRLTMTPTSCNLKIPQYPSSGYSIKTIIAVKDF